MSESIKHECGIALIRLLHPAGYYIDKYGSWDYSLRKMYLMMEKQHNRGQDGAGLAGINIGADPGTRYIHRQRSKSSNAIKKVFEGIYRELNEKPCDVWLGHLRYGTYGNYNIDYVHPVTRGEQLAVAQPGDGREFQPDQHGGDLQSPPGDRAKSDRFL